MLLKRNATKKSSVLLTLVSVCTDGAPAMKGVREGFIGLLKKELPHPESLIAFHCILH